MDFVLTLPEKIHENNSDKINGVLIFVDEFQIINELDDYKESFLWKLRAYIQNQNYVSYVFSGLMGMQDELISEIASQGCFWRKDAYNQHISIHQRNRKIIFNAKGSKSEIHRWGI